MRRLERLLYLLLLANLVFTLSHTAWAVDPSFSTKDYPAGSQPRKLVTGDFNRDGIPDLAVVSGGGAAVLLGNRDGSFQSPVSVATGSGPMGIAVGDMNGDGIPDLVTGNNTGKSVSVLLGNGNGTFQAHRDFSVPNAGSETDVAVGDFNGDGKLDVAAASGQVYAFYGNGDGTVQSAVQVGKSPYGFANIIVSGDFNGDGRTDLIFTDCCDPQTTAAPIATDVYLINGTGGNFTPVTTTDAQVFAMTTLTANGDGIADLDTSFSGCHTPCVGGDVYTGQQGTSFPNRVAALAIPDFNNPIPGPAVAADFNGDGKIDLAYAMSSFANNVSQFNAPEHHAMLIMLGTGAGTWSDTPVDINLGVPVNQPLAWSVTADFNNDDKPDIATVNPDSGIVTVMLNTTGGTTSADFTMSVSPQSATVKAGQSAAASLALTSQGGFNGSVQLSCSGLPGGATCNFSPASLTPTPSKSTSQLTITTTAPSSAALKHYGIGLALPMFALILAGTLSKKRKRWLLIGFVVLGVLLLFSCAGTSKSSGNGGNPSPSPGPSPSPTPPPSPSPMGGTPTGSYTVTISAAGAGVQHATSFTLTVQ